MSTERTVRRWYAPTVLGLVAAGGAAFVISRANWVTTELDGGQGAGATIATTGSDVSPLVSGLAVIIIAAGLAVLASGAWFRRLIGVLVVICAVGGALATQTDPDTVVDAAVSESVAFHEGVDIVTTTHPYPWAAAALFALAAVLGVVVVRWGARWPTMSSRYDAPGARSRSSDLRDESDMWKAMDAGIDPTDDESDTGEIPGPASK